MPPPVFRQVSDAAPDGLRRIVNPDELAAQQNLSGISWSQSEDGACQLRAPRADESGQSHNLSGAQGQSDISQSGSPATETAKFQDRFAQLDFGLRKDGR